MLGLLYVQRLSHANPKYLKRVSSRDLFLVAMVRNLIKYNYREFSLTSSYVTHMWQMLPGRHFGGQQTYISIRIKTGSHSRTRNLDGRSLNFSRLKTDSQR